MIIWEYGNAHHKVYPIAPDMKVCLFITVSVSLMSMANICLSVENLARLPLVSDMTCCFQHMLKRFFPLLAFLHAEKIPKALIAYEKALLWRELFSVAADQALDVDELSEIAYRLAGNYF